MREVKVPKTPVLGKTECESLYIYRFHVVFTEKYQSPNIACSVENRVLKMYHCGLSVSIDYGILFKHDNI